MDWRDRGRVREAAESARVDMVGDARLDARDQVRMVGNQSRSVNIQMLS
jgi:hypothetical protein